MDSFKNQPQEDGQTWADFESPFPTTFEEQCVELNAEGDIMDETDESLLIVSSKRDDVDTDSLEEESIPEEIVVASKQPWCQKSKWLLLVLLIVAIAVAVALGVTLTSREDQSSKSAVGSQESDNQNLSDDQDTTSSPSPSSTELTPVDSSTIPPSISPILTTTDPTAALSTGTPTAGVVATAVPTSLLPVSQPTDAPIILPTDAPILPPTDAPILPPTDAPIILETGAPILPPTDSPVLQPTDAPTMGTSLVKSLLLPLLTIGNEFDDPESYQSQSLKYLESTLSPQTAGNYQVYFALASIFYASSGVHNKRTVDAFAVGEPLLGWISSGNWVTDSNYCTWYGISCTAEGAVSHIELPLNRMYGIFPPEVRLLKDTLEVIDLYSNTFLVAEGDAGNSWIAEMTNLRHLFFGATSFEYAGIPTFIGQLQNLEEVDFSGSWYTNGPIRPEAFANNPMLAYVKLSGNTYTSTIPSTITNHPGIEYLYIADVTFEGVVQTLDFLVGMQSLQETWNDFTQFEGGIPTEVGSLASLVSLSLSFCTLSGTIPTELGNLSFNMDRLWLYQNLLTGTIPTEIAELSRMQYLYLEGNRLSGTVPESLCFLRTPLALLEAFGTDCDPENPYPVECSCCTCCGPFDCGDFD